MMGKVKFKYRSDFCTVIVGLSEVIVYGSGSDWIVRYSQVTNHRKGWQNLFSKRSLAERLAIEIAGQPYEGRFKKVDA